MKYLTNLPLLLTVGFFLGCWTKAKADDLGVYLGQHDYCVAQVDNSEKNREVVRATINGRDVSLIVDTGAPRTILTAACARHLGLEVHDTGEKAGGVGGLVGKGTEGIALINSFRLNHIDINRTNTILVLPKTISWDVADGLLGFDYLNLNAALLPVGGSFFLFKPGTRPVPEIGTFMERHGFRAIPVRYDKGGYRLEGSMNGHPLSLIVDCGAAFSTFDLLYIKQTVEASPPLLDGRKLEEYGFTPRQFSLGSFLVRPIELGAVASPYFSGEGVNALLGYDILGTHDAIIDMGHSILWMK